MAKLSIPARDLGKRHLLGAGCASLAMVPFVEVGSHGPPWPTTAMLLVVLILTQYLVFTPVLVGLLAIWRRCAARWPVVDRGIARPVGAALVIAAVGSVVMHGLIGIGMSVSDMVGSDMSFREAWALRVFDSSGLPWFALTPAVWAVVPRVVWGAFSGITKPE